MRGNKGCRGRRESSPLASSGGLVGKEEGRREEGGREEGGGATKDWVLVLLEDNLPLLVRDSWSACSPNSLSVASQP